MFIVNLLINSKQLSNDELGQPFVSPAGRQRGVVGFLNLLVNILFCGELVGLLHHSQKGVLEGLLFGLTAVLLDLQFVGVCVTINISLLILSCTSKYDL